MGEEAYDLAFVDVAGAVEEGVHCGFGELMGWCILLCSFDRLGVVARE